MNEFLFIRHGQTDWNSAQRVMGRQPIPLNKVGRDQAAKIAAYLKDTEAAAVITSPVKRAVETAQIIVDSRPGLKLIVEEGLNEIDYGEWVNLTITEVTANYPDVWENYHGRPEDMVIPGGETLKQALGRTIETMERLKKKYPEGRLLLVSHADVIKLAIVGLMGWPINMFKSFSMDNGGMILLREHPLLGMRMVWYNPLNGVGKDIRDGQ